MLKWTQTKVQQLSPREIWLFIIGRVFIAFGSGAFAMAHYPKMTRSIALPVAIIGLILLLSGFKGFAKKK
jgi:hypothetical protein